MDAITETFLLPKRHLSWSQMQVWMTNEDRYRREYFEDGKKLDTKYLTFGKGFAKLVEDLCALQKELSCSKEIALRRLVETQNLDKVTEEVLRELETDGISEHKILVKVRGVPMLMFLDKYIDDRNVFREYKSGKVPWTLAKVQSHDQLVVYAVGLRATIGKMPNHCDLDWIETSESGPTGNDFWAKVDSKKLALTGKIKSFHREFDERELDRMEELIVKVAREISAAYRAFIEEI